MKRRATLLSLFLLILPCLEARQSRAPNDWKDFEFLLGDWTWTGGGLPGQGRGVCSFRPDLAGTVLVRKTHLDYAATKDRPAFTHDDLLYIYHHPEDKSLRAIFFDGQDHVILYRVTLGPSGAEFLSEAAPDGTRCRMTYRRGAGDSVIEKFEIAPREKPTEFAAYVEFTATRVSK